MCAAHFKHLRSCAVRSRASSFLTSSLSFRAMMNLYWIFHSFSLLLESYINQQELRDSQLVHLVTLQVRCEHLPVDMSCSIVILHGPLWITNSLKILGHSFSSWQLQHQNQLASIYQTSCGQHCPKS